MKRFLLSLIAFAGVWMTAGAQVDLPSMPVLDWKNDWTIAPETGEQFYLYNTAADGFIKGNMGKGSKFVSAADAGLWTKNSSNVSTELDNKTYYLKMDTDEAFTNETNANSYARNYTYEFQSEKTSIIYASGNRCYNFWKDGNGKFATSYYQGIFATGKKVYEWYLINETQYKNHMAYLAYYDAATKAIAVKSSATQASQDWLDWYLESFDYDTFEYQISSDDWTTEINARKNVLDDYKTYYDKYALYKDENTYVAPANNLTHVTVLRNINNSNWMTLCLPFGMPVPQGWTVKELTGVTYDKGAYDAKFTAITGDIKAGKPYIVKLENAVSEIVYNNPQGVILCDDPEPVTVTEATGHSLTFVGVFEHMDLANCYFISGGKFYFAPEGAGNYTNAYRAIFYTDAQSAGANIAYSFADEETGITSVNENVYENENLYNIAGQRVGENAKGIIIKNGKKYIQK